MSAEQPDTWEATERDLAAVQAEIRIKQAMLPSESWPTALAEARARARKIHERRIALNIAAARAARAKP